MSKTPGTPNGWKVLAAFVLAPMLPAVLFAMLSPAYDGLPDMATRVWKTFVMTLIIGGYVPALIVGLPTYALLRHRLRPTVVICVAAGAFVAALPWALLAFLPTADQASIDGAATIIDGRLTWFGFVENLRLIAQIGALGAIGGAVFWIIVKAWRPAPRPA